METPLSQNANRQQRRQQEREARKQPRTSRIDSSPLSNDPSSLKVDSPSVNGESPSLQPAGPFFNPETQSIQATPWIPPPPLTDSQTPPQEHIPSPPIGGSESSGSESNPLENGLEPLTPKQVKLAQAVSGLYFTVALAALPFSGFAHKAITVEAPDLAESHVRMGRHIKGYLEWLEKLTQYTDFTPFILLHLALFGAIATHHNLPMADAAKEHFAALGSNVTAKVRMMEAYEEQQRQAMMSGMNGAG